MTDVTTTRNRMTIGIDLGDRFSQLCVLDEAGETIEEARLAMAEKAVRQRFASMPPARIAIEAGTHSPWVCALLKELGHEVVVANPRKLRMIFKSDTKNDRLDAEQLARVARMDPRLLSPIEHRGQGARTRRAFGAVAVSVPTSACAPSSGNPVRATRSCGSARREIGTCVGCWCRAPSTCWARSARTRTCDGSG
jgi:hypothetical protein